jgi:hypothetical protein
VGVDDGLAVGVAVGVAVIVAVGESVGVGESSAHAAHGIKIRSAAIILFILFLQCPERRKAEAAGRWIYPSPFSPTFELSPGPV